MVRLSSHGDTCCVLSFLSINYVASRIDFQGMDLRVVSFQVIVSVLKYG